VALTGVSALQAHHSNISIDASTPVWVEGTVVRYEIVNPHAMIELEEATSDGQVRRWTVQGPNLQRLGFGGRMAKRARGARTARCKTASAPVMTFSRGCSS